MAIGQTASSLAGNIRILSLSNEWDQQGQSSQRGPGMGLIVDIGDRALFKEFERRGRHCSLGNLGSKYEEAQSLRL